MVDLKGIHRVKVRGKAYHYAWRGGPRLLSQPGTADYVAELAAAHASRKTGDRRKVSGLCAEYRASPDWTGLSDKTRKDWSRWLDRIQGHFGDLEIAVFGLPQIKSDILDWRDSYAAHPRAADMGMQVLSRLLGFACKRGRLMTNPCAGLGRLYRSDRAGLIWTADDMAELERVASPAIYRAAKLDSLTGLRKSDLLRLQWNHVKAHSIEIATGKSRQRKTTLIPLYDELADYLETIRHKRSPVILLNTEGRPWRSGFGASWNAAKGRMNTALHFHDLRGTAATRFYLGGLSLREIAAILAWSEKQVERLIETYVDKDAILADRIARMNAAGTDTVKTGVKR